MLYRAVTTDGWRLPAKLSNRGTARITKLESNNVNRFATYFLPLPIVGSASSVTQGTSPKPRLPLPSSDQLQTRLSAVVTIEDCASEHDNHIPATRSCLGNAPCPVGSYFASGCTFGCHIGPCPLRSSTVEGSAPSSSRHPRTRLLYPKVPLTKTFTSMHVTPISLGRVEICFPS